MKVKDVAKVTQPFSTTVSIWSSFVLGRCYLQAVLMFSIHGWTLKLLKGSYIIKGLMKEKSMHIS